MLGLSSVNPIDLGRGTAVAGGPIRRQFVVETLLIALICAGYAAIEASLQLNHDVAWLLAAGLRWSQGERLYIDLIEVNPPLVFHFYWLISFGTWTKLGFIAGMLLIVGLSSIWVRRLKGPWWGLATTILVISAGAADFGQRDDLATIVAIPYLFATLANRTERTLIGAFAFAGFALKPYLLLIPIFATLGRMVQDRSWRPAFSPENLAIGALGLVYLVIAWQAYPAFFKDMIPLGRLVYFAYGAHLNSEVYVPLVISAGAFILILGAFRRDCWPQVGGAIGGFVSFFVQGRFWSYQLVPAIALTALVALLLVERRTIRLFIVLGFIFLMGGWFFLNNRRSYPDYIPPGATTVLFLTPHVGPAYPVTFERGVRHASRYPAMWTLPGAWRLLHDPGVDVGRKRQALSVLRATRENAIGDIVSYCPDPIFVDVRKKKPYFIYPFDFESFIMADPRVRGYRPTGEQGMFRVYRRTEPCAGPGVQRQRHS